LRAARALNIPVVLTIHHFSEPGEVLRVPRRYVRGVIAVSQAVREDLVNNARMPKELVRVVCTGIDTESAQSVCTGRGRNNPPVVGTVGTLTSVKGNEYFLQAAKKVIEKGHKVHFVVAGQGEERNRLRKMTKELNLTANLTFATDFTENYEILRALDVFVNPSLREGLGITVLQAMACGVPTISTASGGIHSFVTDGETGLMVPQKDSSAIAMAIIRLLEDREFADKVAANASNMVKSEFPIDRMMDEVFDLYEGVVREWNDQTVG
jgi:glycosyltransferase involved in cell wall biosynthesis